MAKFIDISSRLDDAKPGVIIAPGEQYEINDDKNNIIKMNAEIKKAKSELDGMVIALEMLFGKEALAEIEQNHPGMTTHLGTIKQLFVGALSAVNGDSPDEVEKRFRDTVST